MRESDFHKLIEQSDAEQKKALRKKIVVPQCAEPSHKRKTRWAIVFAPICACLVCLAIILPFALKPEPSAPEIRYCYSDDYFLSPAETTVKEYSESSGKNLLYIDWYDIAEEVQTMWHVHKNNPDDRICLEETLANGETGEIVVLQIVETNVEIDYLVSLQSSLKDTYEYNGVTIKYHTDVDGGTASFVYGNYKYFIETDNVSEERSVLDIAENMLDKK